MNLVSSIFFVWAAVVDAHFLLDYWKCPPVTIPRGRIRLRSEGRIAKYSCNRGYQLLGERYSTCLRGRWDTPPPVCISAECPPLNSLQNAQVLESYRGAVVKIQCDPGYKIIGSSSLYCNGMSWNDTIPYCEDAFQDVVPLPQCVRVVTIQRTTPRNMSLTIKTKKIKYSVQKWCNFESEDLCGWRHDENHDFDWKRHNFATPSGHVGTGPAFDHTLGPGLDGHYMYLETSSPRLENDTARLFSPEYPPLKNNDSCFVFWYHMYGATTGSLHVYLHTHDTTLLFSEHGDHGNHWIKGLIPLPFIPTSFQIVIEGVRGPGYVGDTAIDDVKLANGEECSSSGQVPESCQGRCYSSKILNRSACECHQDCFTSATCCPDFVELCGIVSTPTAGVMPFSSNISSERMTVTPIPSFPIFPLSITASSQSSVLKKKLHYHTPAVIAEHFSENPLFQEQTKNQSLSSFEVNKTFKKQTSPVQNNTFNHENDSTTLNANMTHFVSLNHTLLPMLKNETEKYIGKVSTSFTFFSDSAPSLATNKTELEHQLIHSIIPTFTQTPISSQSLPRNKTVTVPVASTRQYIFKNSSQKEMAVESIAQTILLPPASVFPITVNTFVSVNSTVGSLTPVELNVNSSATIHMFNGFKISTVKPTLNYTSILVHNNVNNNEYVTRLNKLRNMSRLFPLKLNTFTPNITHKNNTSDGGIRNKTVSSTVAGTNMTYKQLFSMSLPKAKNDVLYHKQVNPAYDTHKPLQQPTSEPKVTSDVHVISLPNSKRNSYNSVPTFTTVSYKRTNATHKFFVYATPSKWISKYTSKGKAEKFSAQTSFNMIAGIGTILGVLTLLSIGSGAAVVIIRKRKINRRNNLDNGESDHLTSDEVLDLTWCGPAQPIQQECTNDNQMLICH